MKKKSPNSLAMDYEKDRIYLLKRSEKRAWFITFIFAIITACSFCALVFLFPLKETTPYLIKEDSKTGIPYIVTGLDPVTFSPDEALDKYFVNYYINIRNSYTYQTIQHTYEQTQLYSSPQTAKNYREEFEKEKSLDEILKQGTATVKVISIALEQFRETKLATARVEITYKTQEGEKHLFGTKKFLIKLTYDYKPESKMNLSYRIENPLGFFVTSYQIIEEAF